MATKKQKHLRHPWLEANDPANAKLLSRGGIAGFWVPTPAEIEHQCELMKERNLKLKRKSFGGIDFRGCVQPLDENQHHHQRATTTRRQQPTV